MFIVDENVLLVILIFHIQVFICQKHISRANKQTKKWFFLHRLKSKCSVYIITDIFIVYFYHLMTFNIIKKYILYE